LKKDIEKPLPKITTPQIVIKRNVFDNFEHSDTGLVFNNKTKLVIGKQLENGEIDRHLTEKDIDNCHHYKFKYVLPENLDNNKNSDKDKQKNDGFEEIDNKLGKQSDNEEEVEEIDEEVEEIEEEVEAEED